MSINFDNTIHITPIPDSYSIEETDALLADKLDKAPNGTNDLIGEDSKISSIYLPDIVMGNMVYGGTFDATTATATLTDRAKLKLGTTSDTIVLTNDTTAVTGYRANEGIYYIVSVDGTFAGLDCLDGDWLISTGSGWSKIDNTDAVTGVKGNAESNYRVGNVNITADNVLPTQANNSGKYLTTDGTNASWGTVSIPTVNDATLTLTQGSSTLGTFSANAGSDTTIDIPTPTIPTVNNATLTLTQGGSTLGTFTANADTDVTIAIANADLTNYYNKSETDTLLDEKQDALTPTVPIAIEQKVVTPVVGMTYGQGNQTIYSTNGSSIQLSSSGISGDYNQSGYIDIPYTFGQTVCSGKKNGTYNLSGAMSYYSNVIFGKYINDEFIPILYATSTAQTNGTEYFCLNTSDTSTLSVTTITPNKSAISSFGGTSVSDASLVYGNISRLTKNTSSFDIVFTDAFRNNTSYSWIALCTATITDASQFARLSEITVARVIPTPNKGTSASNTLDITTLGLYNYEGSIAAATYTTQNALGENIFSTEPYIYKSLELNVGSGLAVDNGNLVNTNPPIVITNSTSYGLITPDSNTLYILTDTGAIYLGTTLIAQKNS